MKTNSLYASIVLTFIIFQAQAQSEPMKQSCDAFNSSSYMIQPETNTFSSQTNEKKPIRSSGKRDRLFLLNPNFTDSRLQPEGQHYFCPFNAMLEGILKYYPFLKDSLEITHVDFPRPRTSIVEIVGEENQGLPLMVIEKMDGDLSSISVKEFNDTFFIMGTEQILRYLAKTYGIPLPHP